MDRKDVPALSRNLKGDKGPHKHCNMFRCGWIGIKNQRDGTQLQEELRIKMFVLTADGSDQFQAAKLNP